METNKRKYIETKKCHEKFQTNSKNRERSNKQRDMTLYIRGCPVLRENGKIIHKDGRLCHNLCVIRELFINKSYLLTPELFNHLNKYYFYFSW